MYPNVQSSIGYNCQDMEQPKCLSTDASIKNMWYIYTTDYNSAIKKNEIMLFATTWLYLEDITLSEISQRNTNTVCYHL